ncbi:hypothetical protein BS78_03G331000 [Paspalum vaginatum]|nr:hypothetical protein BS78_03G331000 [Paspalum vaginatum]
METPQQGVGGPGGAHGQEVPVGGPLSPPLSPASAADAALANARWNPTKEQVAVLEGLYEHGLRTPSAEQIQQITVKLRQHGHIEGKNVFYWFQNHKARQRQKQKQDSFAYFSRLLRRPPPLPVLPRPPGPPPYPRVPPPSPAPAMEMAMAPPPAASACNTSGSTQHVLFRNPFYMPTPQAPAANAAAYQRHHQQMAIMYQRMEAAGQGKTMVPAAAQQQHPAAMFQQGAAPTNSTTSLHVLRFPPANGAPADRAGPSRETLQLFPLQPTFVLPDQGRAAAAGSASATATASASFSEESESLESPDSNGDAPAQPFYDFLGLQSGGR